MTGLVGYGSSDEDENLDQCRRDAPVPAAAKHHYISEPVVSSIHTSQNGSAGATVQISDNEHSATAELMGPLGPPQATMPDMNTEFYPSSPYTSQRATIRNLTLPINPNFDIPLSPSGSPTNVDQKFAHFLELKRQGIHFNARLTSSSALKNPSLLPKLLKSAGVDDEKQYATTLSLELWDPLGFPEWAYKEELGKSQQDLTRRKAEQKARSQRERLDFVAAGNSAQASRGAAPGASSMAVRGSAAERVMAGLDKNRRESPQKRIIANSRGPTIQAKDSSRSPRRRRRSRSR